VAVSAPFEKGKGLLNHSSLVQSTSPIPLKNISPNFYSSFVPHNPTKNTLRQFPSMRTKSDDKPKDKVIQDGDNPKVEGFGLAGFILAVLAVLMIPGAVYLFIPVFLMGLLGLIFGIISIIKIKKQPKKYRGKGFAITAIVLGILTVLISLIIVAAILLMAIGGITLGI
jgi:hypothetical protein